MSLNKEMTISAAIENIKSRQMVLVGGFGLIGSSLSIIQYLTEYDVSNLTVVNNNVDE